MNVRLYRMIMQYIKEKLHYRGSISSFIKFDPIYYPKHILLFVLENWSNEFSNKCPEIAIWIDINCLSSENLKETLKDEIAKYPNNVLLIDDDLTTFEKMLASARKKFMQERKARYETLASSTYSLS